MPSARPLNSLADVSCYQNLHDNPDGMLKLFIVAVSVASLGMLPELDVVLIERSLRLPMSDVYDPMASPTRLLLSALHIVGHAGGGCCSTGAARSGWRQTAARPGDAGTGGPWGAHD